MTFDEVDWPAVAEDMQRGWNLLSEFRWSPAERRWVPVHQTKQEEAK